MLKSRRIRVNGRISIDARHPLTAKDVIDIGRKDDRGLLPPELTLLYEDDWILVTVKAAGLLTVATKAGEGEETAHAYLNAYLGAKKGRERIHVVHRIDRDTSGVLLFAKDFETRELLKDAFAAHDIDRVYVAIVEGALDPEHGTIQSYLRENPKTFLVQSTPRKTEGKLAVTHYRTIARGERYSMLEVTLETGRKNQIRAHLSEAGHPVIGDERYGSTTNPIGRLGLHAKLLGFVHPHANRKLSFTDPIPDAFARLKL